ncbi:dymeclin isoform X1, partial [Tachysurus ichikawai]
MTTRPPADSVHNTGFLEQSLEAGDVPDGSQEPESQIKTKQILEFVPWCFGRVSVFPELVTSLQHFPLYCGLWSVFTLGGASSKLGAEQEHNPLPLSNQSLLLLLVLANLTDGPDWPNPYRQAITCFKNTQDTSSIPSPQPHMFQINFNSLYTALCEQQKSDQVTLLLYTLLHQNSNMKTYMLSRTDMENL